MMAGIYYGAKYGGSTTSILLNIPGESASVVTCIDGYAMAKQGRAGPARNRRDRVVHRRHHRCHRIDLPGTCRRRARGGLRAAGVLRLMAFALILVIMLAGDSVLKGFIAIFGGLFLATIGIDLFSGQQRFTGGRIELASGIEFIALSVGVFAVGEVLVNIEKESGRRSPGAKGPAEPAAVMARHDEVAPGDPAGIESPASSSAFCRAPGRPSPRSFPTSWRSGRRSGPKTSEGLDRGRGAPEAANNSETGGAMIPLLTLGIPGSGNRRRPARRSGDLSGSIRDRCCSRKTRTWSGRSSPACTWGTSHCW